MRFRIGSSFYPVSINSERCHRQKRVLLISHIYLFMKISCARSVTNVPIMHVTGSFRTLWHCAPTLAEITWEHFWEFCQFTSRRKSCRNVKIHVEKYLRCKWNLEFYQRILVLVMKWKCFQYTVCESEIV